DKIGRKVVMLSGIVMMLVLYFPGYQFITAQGNPPLAHALATVPATVIADPADCTFQLDLTGGARQFSTSCDIPKGSLTNAGVAYTTQAGPPGSLARVRIGNAEIQSVSAVGKTNTQVKAARAAFDAQLRPILTAAGYPAHAPGAMTHWSVSEILRAF